MESDNKDTSRDSPAKCDETFLRHKRNLRDLKENYLFRRHFSGKVYGKYEKVANTYYNMMAFNWDDEKLSKNRNSIMMNLRAGAFWFYICSMYFPYITNDLNDKLDSIPDTIRLILEKMANSKGIVKKSFHVNTKVRLLNDLLTCYKKGELSLSEDDIQQKKQFTKDISLDGIIEAMTKDLSQVEAYNSAYFKSLFQKISQSGNDEISTKYILTDRNDFHYIEDNILMDLEYDSKPIKKFIEHVIKTDEEKASMSSGNQKKLLFQPEEDDTVSNPDDVVCVICNDGDYEDNDLIVYCSSCHVTVHQSCYGIFEVPEEDWICHLCLTLGKSSNVECILCPVKGGAVKPCSLKKSSAFYSYIINLRKGNNDNTSHKLDQTSEEIKIPMPQVSVNDIKKDCENIITLDLTAIKNETDLRDMETHNEKMEIVNDNNQSENYPCNVLEKSNHNYIHNHNHNSISASPAHEDKIVTYETNKQTNLSNSSKNRRGRRRKYFQKDKQKANSKGENENSSDVKILSKSNSIVSGNNFNIKKIKINGVNDFINNKIANEHAWVHMSCALWIPEVNINDFTNKEEIRNIDSIAKKRFLEKCEICLLEGYGPTIKCEKCELRFHVECARMNKYQLETTANQMGENKYHVFCQSHAPHKLIKNLELKRQRNIDDILQFSTVLERNYDLLRKMNKHTGLSVFSQSKKMKNEISNKKRHAKNLGIKEKKRLLKAIRGLAIEISNMHFKLLKKPEEISIESPPHTDSFSYIIDHEKKNQKIAITYYDMLNPKKFPWYLLKESESYLSGMSPYDIYSAFKALVPNELEYMKIILKKNVKKVAIPLQSGKEPTFVSIPAVDLNDSALYCYCKKKTECDEFMIGCEYLDKCVHNGWVHQECVEELKNLTKEQIEDENFKFVCKECKELYETSK